MAKPVLVCASIICETLLALGNLAN